MRPAQWPIAGALPPEEECTVAQLSALQALLQSGAAPYVDFALWGPYHVRTLKRLKCSGLQLHASGHLHQVEMFGPPTIEDWEACFRVRLTGLLGFSALRLGTGLAFLAFLRRDAARDGASVWRLLYQAELRRRRELLERLRRRVFEKMARSQGIS